MKRRKITKESLDELARNLPIISEDECRSYIGGGDGSPDSPYTETEMDQMIESGSWQGGYVLINNRPQYMGPGVICSAPKSRMYNYSQTASGYVFAEHMGAVGGLYNVSGNIVVGQGQLTVSSILRRITTPPGLGDGEFSAVAELYVDGQLVERRSIQRHEQAYLTTLGDVPVGEAVFDIRPYYGRRVEVKIGASMRFDGGYGQGAVRNMTIPVYSSQP